MAQRRKYKIWKVSDLYRINKLVSDGYSPDLIAIDMGITRNALYKAMKRLKIYSQIVGPRKSVEVCSASDIYKLADDLCINKNIGVINILNQINMSRRNTELPRLTLC